MLVVASILFDEWPQSRNQAGLLLFTAQDREQPLLLPFRRRFDGDFEVKRAHSSRYGRDHALFVILRVGSSPGAQ